MNLHTWVWTYILGCEPTFLGMNLHTWVWTYILGCEPTYLGMNLNTWVWTYIHGCEPTYQGVCKPTLWNLQSGSKTRVTNWRPLSPRPLFFGVAGDRRRTLVVRGTFQNKCGSIFGVSWSTRQPRTGWPDWTNFRPRLLILAVFTEVFFGYIFPRFFPLCIL
jgi:hypothetical protein